MNKPRAVIFAAHPWNGIPYGLHHIGRALARLGWELLYVEPHFSPLHLAGGRRRGRVLGRKPRPTDTPGLSVLSPFTLVPHANVPLLRSPATIGLSRFLSWPRLDQTGLAGTPFAKPDLVLCGSPAMAAMALGLGARMSLYRLADDSSLFDVLTPALRQAEMEAITRFDGVIVTSDALMGRAKTLGARRAVMVSNGVDRAFFERPAPPPAAMTALPQPRILYAGAVEKWFDWPLVLQAATARPAYSFALVGRIGSPPPSPLPPNVHLLGPRPYAEMPAFMQAADVGVIPFALAGDEAAIRAINPLKLYEYLAAGRPAVSAIAPPDLMGEGLFVYDGLSDFLRCLDEAVALRLNKAAVAAPTHVDWRVIVQKMLDELALPHGP